ncbi:MAG: tRNA (N(6)-L-threonylcarbamoyladenosine(37)-C(2))-methylthiotransferase MtaB [Anaerolineales bacterium]
MRIYLDTIGCRLNQAEIERMARQFRAAGHEIVATAAEADLTVVNTCTVTSAAASDSRARIRSAARSGTGEVVVTGCWATLVPQQALDLPGVKRIVSNDQKDSLVEATLHVPLSAFNLEPIARQMLPGLRQRTRAFIKVQDGCDNACTFCITTVARGAGRSRPIRDVLADIHSALMGGSKEIVLTGVHLGSWGQEWGMHLRTLIQAILTDTDTPRLRLSSLEPWDLDVDFFRLWEDARLMPHLHLPLQSGCAATLRRMARKTTPAAFRALVAAARQAIPGVAITTDVIAGFPGESEAEFNESLAFIREIEFAGGHAFTYSARPGTPAARMKGSVPHPIRKQRNALLRQAFAEMSAAYRQGFIGRSLPVLWETSSQMDEDGWQMEGLTGNYIRVTALMPVPRWNQVDIVELERLNGDRMEGRLVGDFSPRPLPRQITHP